MTQPRTQSYPVGIAIFKGAYPLDNIASRIVGGKPWHQNKYLAKLDGDGQEYLIMAQTFDKHLLGDFYGDVTPKLPKIQNILPDTPQ